MVTPRPHWKMRQIDSPSPLENPIPSVGGGVWIFSGTTHFEDINISFFSHNLQHHFLIELYLSFQLLFTMAKNHLEFCFACITTVSQSCRLLKQATIMFSQEFCMGSTVADSIGPYIIISIVQCIYKCIQLIQWRLLWALGIGHQEAIVWWSLRQIITLFCMLKCPTPNC